MSSPDRLFPDYLFSASPSSTSRSFTMFDFTELVANDEGTFVDLLDPRNGQPTGATLRLMPLDSPRVREKQREIAKRNLQKRKFRKSGDDPDFEQLEEDTLDILAECVLGWEGVRWKGEDLPFSKENVKMICRAVPPIRRQIDSLVSDLNVFTQRSAKPAESSQSTSGPSQSDPTALP